MTPTHRIVRLFLSTATAGALLGLASACSTSNSTVLTWSQDAKREGIRQYNDGRYPQAAAAFTDAIRQNPTDPQSEYYLALSYEQVGSYHEAINAYKLALALMPPPSSVRFDAAMHDSAFDRIAHVIAKTDTNGTETDLIAKEAADQKSSEQYRLLGRICRYRGDADTAIDNYRTSVHLDPENLVAQRELGLYLVQLGQNQDAAVVLRDAYRLDQNDKQINSALERLGMVPGPALMEQNQPIKPVATDAPLTPSDPALLPASETDGPAPQIQAPKD